MYTCMNGNHAHAGPSYRVKDMGWFCFTHMKDAAEILGKEVKLDQHV